MDSKMTYVSILFSSLLAITALCILGLAADNISHVQNHSSHSAIDIHYQRWNQTAHRPYQYWVTMDYLPSKFTLSGMEGMLAASVIAGIVGVCVAVTSCLHRMDAKKQQQRSSAITLVNLVLSAIAFIVTLATAAHAWKPVMRYPIKFINSLPLPPQYKAHSTAHSEVRYQSPFPYTPEVWNCQLWPYVVQKDLSTRLHNLCQEAGVAKDLMIVAVLLSTAQLVCVVWTWRKARLAAADVTNGVKEVDEMSIISKK